MFRAHRIVWKLKSAARDFLCAVRVLERGDEFSLLKMGMSQNFWNTQNAPGRNTCPYHQRLPFRCSASRERAFHFAVDSGAIFPAQFAIAITRVRLQVRPPQKIA